MTHGSNKPRLLKYTNEKLVPLESATFAQLGIREREDLQRLLRDQIEIIEPGLYVLCEEFSEWQDSKRRVDLLCLDADANLVIVELKRTEDGGHMELQALRYAAMCSPMTFEQAVEAHKKYLDQVGRDCDAQDSLLEFLTWDKPQEKLFGNKVRVILVSEDFSKEITATVLWLNALNAQQMNIRCVRLKPYTLGPPSPSSELIFVDVQPIIPLPEASDYIVRLNTKADSQRRSSRAMRSPDEVWRDFDAKCPDPSVVALARELDEWSETLTDEPVPLVDGFARLIRARGRNYYFFKLRPDGKIVLTFHYFTSKPPFTEPTTRAELLNRVNAIPGVEVPEEQLSKKPNFPLANFLDETNKNALKQFIEWAIETARSTED